MPYLIADDLPRESAGKRFRALLERPEIEAPGLRPRSCGGHAPTAYRSLSPGPLPKPVDTPCPNHRRMRGLPRGAKKTASS